MKKPQSIQIFNLTYGIKWEKNRAHRESPDWGRCNSNIPCLVMFMPQSNQQLADTMLHEVIHAIYRHYGVGESMLEEEVATRIASGLMTVKQQNPNFWKWWESLT